MNANLRMLICVAAIIAFGFVCFICGGEVSLIVKEQRIHKDTFIHDRDASLQIIREDPAFSKVEVNEASWDSPCGVFFTGFFEIPIDYLRFEMKIKLAFGTEKARCMMSSLSVPPETTLPTKSK